VAEFFVSLKFGNDVVALRKTLTLSAETILYASASAIGLFGICFVLQFYLATQHGGLLRIFLNISESINYQTREILSYLAISY
jgi:hypothetical protein